jgi:hypothetical protein
VQTPTRPTLRLSIDGFKSEQRGKPVEVLVSYCARPASGHGTLSGLNAASLELRLIAGVFGAGPDEEIAGLAADRDFVYVAARRPAALIILSRPDLRLVRRHALPELENLHSLCVRQDELFLVSTGTDEVVRFRMRGARILSQSLFWRPPGSAVRADARHLNGLCFFQDELHVSGFGEKMGETWAASSDGFIRNLERNETVAAGLRHPHSLLPLDDGLAYCESGRRTVHLPGRSPVHNLPGYARGLCRVGDHLFVGASSRRLVSRSTGKAVPQPDPDGLAERCSVSRIALRSGSVDLMTDLSWHGGEIYDLLPLSDAS